MCKKQTAVFHSNAESEIISLVAGLRMDGLPALQFWECVLESLFSKPAKRIVERHERESAFQTHSHSDKCVLSQFTTFRPTFPKVHIRPNSTYSKTMRPWSKWSTEDETQTWVTSPERTESIWIGCWTEWLWIIWLWQLTCEQTINWRIFDKGNVNHDAMAFIRPCESKRLRSFSRKLFSCSFSKAPTNFSGENTNRECWPEMESIRVKNIEKQVALWIITWLWSNWAIMFLIVQKTRGMFLQECFFAECGEKTLARWYVISDLEITGFVK